MMGLGDTKYEPKLLSLPLFNFFLKSIYLFLRERERESEHTGRGGDTESEAGSRLRAVNTEPDAGPELTNREIMT